MARRHFENRKESYSVLHNYANVKNKDFYVTGENMINEIIDNTDKQEYQTPVLFEYGDIASVTQYGSDVGPDLAETGFALSGT